MELLILNDKFETVSVIDNFKSCIWTDRYDKCGDFELYLLANDYALSYVVLGYYLWFKESEHLMIIEDFKVETDIEFGNYFVVTGRSIESILERRIVWNQTNVRGKLQDVIKRIITDAFISPAIPERKISNFVFQETSDPYLDSITIDTQYTGDNIYDIITELCSVYGIGFKIVLNNNNQFVFSLYSGEDRSYDQIANPYVIFSPEFENIINSNFFSSNKNVANVTLIAGEGEGADRRTAVYGNESGLARKEIFTDARDISSNVDGTTLTDAEYTNKLLQRGYQKLLEHIHETAFEGEVEATRTFKYGEDFFIGDDVQIANEYGHEGTARIIELVFSQDESGVYVYPTFQMINEEG